METRGLAISLATSGHLPTTGDYTFVERNGLPRHVFDAKLVLDSLAPTITQGHTICRIDQDFDHSICEHLWRPGDYQQAGFSVLDDFRDTTGSRPYNRDAPAHCLDEY